MIPRHRPAFRFPPARVLIAIMMFLSLSAETARAGEFYYSIIFGSESKPKKLRYTHTWATFIRAVGEGPDPRNYRLEINNIGWLPRTLDIKVWRPKPEPGVNLDLYQSLAAVYQGGGQHVTMWGPFVEDRETWNRSIQVAQFLNSGAPKYRAIDGPFSPYIYDCVHAVTMVDDDHGRGHYPLIRIGEPASRYISHQIMMLSDENQRAFDNSWLIPRLGLDRYPITHVPPQRIPGRNCGLCRRPE
jgi:hypothetical protein